MGVAVEIQRHRLDGDAEDGAYPCQSSLQTRRAVIPKYSVIQEIHGNRGHHSGILRRCRGLPSACARLRKDFFYQGDIFFLRQGAKGLVLCFLPLHAHRWINEGRLPKFPQDTRAAGKLRQLCLQLFFSEP
jgi:hypothetical protein